MEKRRLVKTVKMRLADAQVGDVVNRYVDETEGWFEVASFEELFNGSLQVADETTYITITGGYYDTIGVQVITEVEVPDQTKSAPKFVAPKEVASSVPESADH